MMKEVLAFLDPVWDSPDTTLFLQLLVALSAGMLLGAERVLAGKTAGVRTHALVAMTATLTVALGLRYLEHSGNSDDLFRIIQGIVTGIGFLGAGIILLRGNQIQGLTTAAGLWFTSGIGIAIGLGFYVTALLATALALFVYRVLWSIEQGVKEILAPQDDYTSAVRDTEAL